MAVTYNMAGGSPKSQEDLDQLFQKNNVENDVYFFATQEACRSITASMLMASKDKLNNMIKQYFGITSDGKGEFFMVHSNTLAAISSIIIIRKNYLHLVSNIQTNFQVLGFANSLPNKGAVSISFNLGKRRLLFISCHLDAHIQNRKSRMEQWLEIKTNIIDSKKG